MAEAAEARGSQWIRGFRRADPGSTRLICFPHAGGSASFYFPLSKALSTAVDVRAVQYPGRQDRRAEQPIADLEELADRSYAELREALDAPLALFGHSMGAVVAFEVARRLERESGIIPEALIVSGWRAPAINHDEGVHRRDDDALIAEVQRLSGTHAALLADEELLRVILPAIRSDYQAIETHCHRAGPRLACPITALVGDADPIIAPDEARGWRDYTDAEFAFHLFRGGHFYLTERADEVTEVIARCLSRGRGVPASPGTDARS